MINSVNKIEMFSLLSLQGGIKPMKNSKKNKLRKFFKGRLV